MRLGGAGTAIVVTWLLLAGGPARAGVCREDPLIRELDQSGDAFRAVTVLRQQELAARGTPDGFECARMILGRYLRHDELDLVDDWVGRMARHYAPLILPAAGGPARLRVEVAYLTGNSAEVTRRAQASGLPRLNGLVTLAAAAEAPLSFDAARASPPACGDQGCADLRLLLDQRASLPLKSPGLALALGVVPGLGQVYAGRALSGLGSFLLNAFLGGLTAYGIHRHEYALATLTGAAGLAVYAGGIYAGYEAALRRNERESELLRARIRAIPVDLALARLAM
jgi:TM2 domain-containing membrane protein YozV